METPNSRGPLTGRVPGTAESDAVSELRERRGLRVFLLPAGFLALCKTLEGEITQVKVLSLLTCLSPGGACVWVGARRVGGPHLGGVR